MNMTCYYEGTCSIEIAKGLRDVDSWTWNVNTNK